ncbi:hypothetical protein F8388_026822 [Cannabis sativa]|uniref:Uncharacterized protein n=1 Tax=Cannabis sativa TaxID=3483 RepID=A0A7J6H1Q3_CANSA|nr:hypothetical protein F8388_026822 [Cannabis sativa]
MQYLDPKTRKEEKNQAKPFLSCSLSHTDSLVGNEASLIYIVFRANFSFHTLNLLFFFTHPFLYQKDSPGFDFNFQGILINSCPGRILTRGEEKRREEKTLLLVYVLKLSGYSSYSVFDFLSLECRGLLYLAKDD